MLEAFGGIDILVNNAGITRDRLFKKMAASDWEEVIDTNLSSVFHVTKQFIDPMEIGAAVLFLASPASGFITGHALDVNGGFAM